MRNCGTVMVKEKPSNCDCLAMSISRKRTSACPSVVSEMLPITIVSAPSFFQ